MSDPLPSQKIALRASLALREELQAYPKPGLVSLVDNGSHPDLDADCFLSSIDAIEPYFAEMAQAGSNGCALAELQKIGLAAEAAMFDATQKRNTHRGAIFCLGLLSAAAGARSTDQALKTVSLGEIVKEKWGESLPIPADLPASSHGLRSCHEHRVDGVRGEARRGFPSVFETALPVFRETIQHTNRNAACVQTYFTLLTVCEDTTLLHRGGVEGWNFAREAARRFLEYGGVFNSDWESLGTAIHREFVQKNLTAGGAADLLASTLFVDQMESLHE